jgi:TRAP-type uncharacterized transport system substrate-binding protein
MLSLAAILTLVSVAASAEQRLQMVPYKHPVFHNGHRVLFHGVWRGSGGGGSAARAASAAPEEDKPAPVAANHDFTVLADTEDNCASRMAVDLVNALRAAGLKARPLAGKGSPDALGRYVVGDAADLAIVPLDALQSDGKAAEWRDRAPVVVKLANEPIEIIAGRGIADISQLADRPVSLGSADSDADASAEALFRRLGIKPKVVHESLSASLADLAAGKVDAVALFGAGDSKTVNDFGKDGRFHLVPIAWTPALAGLYAPARLTNKERPNLIGANDKIDTLATPMALIAIDAAANTVRANQDAAVVSAVFNKFDALLTPASESSWGEVNLAASVDWPRLTAAADWLDSHRREADAALASFRETAHSVAVAKDGPGAADADRLYRGLALWRSATP